MIWMPGRASRISRRSGRWHSFLDHVVDARGSAVQHPALAPRPLARRRRSCSLAWTTHARAAISAQASAASGRISFCAVAAPRELLKAARASPAKRPHIVEGRTRSPDLGIGVGKCAIIAGQPQRPAATAGQGWMAFPAVTATRCAQTPGAAPAEGWVNNCLCFTFRRAWPLPAGTAPAGVITTQGPRYRPAGAQSLRQRTGYPLPWAAGQLRYQTPPFTDDHCGAPAGRPSKLPLVLARSADALARRGGSCSAACRPGAATWRRDAGYGDFSWNLSRIASSSMPPTIRPVFPMACAALFAAHIRATATGRHHRIQ